MMCIFVGNTGSVVANIDSFPCNIERYDFSIYINGICVYDDEECDDEYVNELYASLMQTLVETITKEYPSKDVAVIQVGE